MQNRSRALLARAAALIGSTPIAFAQDPAPNAALANELIASQLPGRSVAALVTHRPGATRFSHAAAIFPGSPGYSEHGFAVIEAKTIKAIVSSIRTGAVPGDVSD